MKKISKLVILAMVIMTLFSMTGCGSIRQSYKIDSYYFEDVQFERKMSSTASFEGNVGTITGHDYYIKLSSKCSYPLYEYTVKSVFYDTNNSKIYEYEQTFSKEIKANELIEIYCNVSYDVYSKVDNTNTVITGKSYTNPNEGAKNIKKPIESISFNYDSQAIQVGDIIELKAIITPSDTDDTLIWTSSHTNVATVNNGTVKAVNIGNTVIEAKAKNGTKYQLVNFKVMPVSKSTDINQCKTKTNSAILTIENKSYNAFLGIPTKSETKTFTGVIFKRIGNKCYFITGYSNFEKADGYDYQDWTVTDCNGKNYDLSNITYEKSYTLGNNFKLAVGYIEATNLSALEISSRDKFFKNERIYIKSGSTYVESKVIETTTNSPITTQIPYQNNLYGSPVLDSELNFIGIGIRKDVFTNGLDFVSSNFMQKFVNSCNIE